jgi:hypothetical protein
MSTVYRVKSVAGEPREWTSKQGGTFLSYKVDLEADGNLERGIEWNRKPESQPPKVDEYIAGHIEEGKYGDRFKMDYEATKEIGQSPETSIASSSHAPSYGKSPDIQRQITRQHSQGMAVQVLPHRLAVTETPLSAEGIKALLKEWTDWFDADVFGQTSSQIQGAQDSQAGAAPPPAASPGSEKGPADVSLTEIEQALDTAGLINAEARGKVSAYMVSELSMDRIVVAVRKLAAQDIEAQSAALGSLKTLTEKWTGEPLPTESAFGDEPPF